MLSLLREKYGKQIIYISVEAIKRIIFIKITNELLYIESDCNKRYKMGSTAHKIRADKMKIEINKISLLSQITIICECSEWYQLTITCVWDGLTAALFIFLYLETAEQKNHVIFLDIEDKCKCCWSTCFAVTINKWTSLRAICFTLKLRCCDASASIAMLLIETIGVRFGMHG